MMRNDSKIAAVNLKDRRVIGIAKASCTSRDLCEDALQIYGRP
jgi:hypothetical protein